MNMSVRKQKRNSCRCAYIKQNFKSSLSLEVERKSMPLDGHGKVNKAPEYGRRKELEAMSSRKYATRTEKQNISSDIAKMPPSVLIADGSNTKTLCKTHQYITASWRFFMKGECLSKNKNVVKIAIRSEIQKTRTCLMEERFVGRLFPHHVLYITKFADNHAD